jgi:SET domain-containing protein
MKAYQLLNFEVKATIKPSIKINGIGVFALRNISAGEELDECTKPYFNLTTKEFKKLHPYVQKIILDRQFMNNREILIFNHPNNKHILQTFMNHSTIPNSNGLCAIHDILEGEEITEDYTQIGSSEPHPLLYEHTKSFVNWRKQ